MKTGFIFRLQTSVTYLLHKSCLFAGNGVVLLCYKIGNHIDVASGKWTAQDAGIGAGVDSYFEYLVKGAVLFQKPQLMKEFHGILYIVYSFFVVLSYTFHS